MKTRIVLTLITLLTTPFVINAFFKPVETLSKNKAAVATLNGDDAAYVVQQTVESGFSVLGAVAALLYLGVLIAIWAVPAKKLLSTTE